MKPIGENGTYLQTMRSRGYNITRNSTVTVEVAGQTRTFKQGEHVTFPVTSGGKQTVTLNGAQFIGTNAAPVAGLDLRGKLAVWMNATAAAGAGRFARIPQNAGVNGAISAGATGAVGFAPAPVRHRRVPRDSTRATTSTTARTTTAQALRR